MFLRPYYLALEAKIFMAIAITYKLKGYCNNGLNGLKLSTVKNETVLNNQGRKKEIN